MYMYLGMVQCDTSRLSRVHLQTTAPRGLSFSCITRNTWANLFEKHFRTGLNGQAMMTIVKVGAALTPVHV